jgi:hypothetical protein
MTHIFQHLRNAPSDFDGVEIYATRDGEDLNSRDVQFLEPAKCEEITFDVCVHVRAGSARATMHDRMLERVLAFPDYTAAVRYAQTLAEALGVPEGSIEDYALGVAQTLPHRFYKQARTLLRR